MYTIPRKIVFLFNIKKLIKIARLIDMMMCCCEYKRFQFQHKRSPFEVAHYYTGTYFNWQPTI